MILCGRRLETAYAYCSCKIFRPTFCTALSGLILVARGVVHSVKFRMSRSSRGKTQRAQAGVRFATPLQGRASFRSRRRQEPRRHEAVYVRRRAAKVGEACNENAACCRGRKCDAVCGIRRARLGRRDVLNLLLCYRAEENERNMREESLRIARIG